MRWSFSALLIGAAILASSSPPLLAADDSDVAELRRFLSVPASARFEAALATRDLRFLGVYGYAPEVPGVPQSEIPRISENGVLKIPGTSDALLSREHGRLNEQARAYAEQYNALLIRHLAQSEP